MHLREEPVVSHDYFEYLVESSQAHSRDTFGKTGTQLEAQLMKRGSEGWQLCALSLSPTGTFLVFIRKIRCLT